VFTAYSGGNPHRACSTVPETLFMRHPFNAAIVAVALALATAAIAQTQPSPPTPVPVAVPAGSVAAAPVPVGKRMACQASAQAMSGQDKRDHMQLCIAQVRFDCLKQAIDQKIVGPQRRDFIRTCAE
jgi:hypothetical protein